MTVKSLEPDAFLEATLNEFRRRVFTESMERVKYCLRQLTEEEVWYRPNENSNSVGKLVLHLCGNARQWIVAGLSDKPDVRQRDAEFSERGPLPSSGLVKLLEETEEELEETLQSLNAENLLQEYAVQGFQELGINILIHVIEHFSYHTGQITYFVKARKDIDTGYYSGLDLNKK